MQDARKAREAAGIAWSPRFFEATVGACSHPPTWALKPEVEVALAAAAQSFQCAPVQPETPAAAQRYSHAASE